MSTTVSELVYARQLLEELGIVFSAASQVFSDSRAARLLADHGAGSSRTRHIHRRWHFVRFHTDDGDVWISPIKGARNPANGLTKITVPLGPCFFVNGPISWEVKLNPSFSLPSFTSSG